MIFFSKATLLAQNVLLKIPSISIVLQCNLYHKIKFPYMYGSIFGLCANPVDSHQSLYRYHAFLIIAVLQ